MTTYGDHPLVGRRAGFSYFGPGGPGIRERGDTHHAARQQEGDATYWFALECAQADPETFEPIRGRSPSSVGRYPSQDRTQVVKNHAARNRGDIELPDFAVIRTGPSTAKVIHIPTGINLTVRDRTIPGAIALQKSITAAFAKMGRVVE